MGYPTDLLSTRAVVKPGLFAVIPKDGLVNNVIPGITGCRISIVASPKMGASFVQYIVTAEPGAQTDLPFAREEGVESFLYVIEGELKACDAGDSPKQLTAGGYVFAPPGHGIEFENKSDRACKLLLYKQKFIPCGDFKPHTVYGNVNDIPFRIYDDMENVFIKDLLPADLAFDMNMHILSFEPGGCHPIVETHVQEHGAYVTEGEGIYTLGPDRIHVKKEDFLFMGAFTEQATYATGRGRFSYVYSKDFNRDVEL